MKRPKLHKNEDQSKQADLRTVLSNGFWVFKILFQMSPITMGTLVLTTFLIAAIPTLTFYLFGVLIDRITEIPFGTVENLQQIIQETDLLKFVIGYASILTLDRLIRYLDSYLDSKVNYYYMEIFEIEITKKVSDLDVQRFENPESMNIIKKGSDNVWRLYSFYQNSVQISRK